MPNYQDLDIIVRLKDETAAAFSSLTRRISKFTTMASSRFGGFAVATEKVGRSMERLGTKMKMTGRSMSMGLTLPIVAGFTAMTKVGSDFSATMEQLHTQAGAKQSEVGIMSKKILSFVAQGQTAQTPLQLAQMLFHIESMSTKYRGGVAFDLMSQAAHAADVGVQSGGLSEGAASDLGENVANALGASVIAGIKGAGNATQAMGTLNAIIGAGNMKMKELAGGLGTGIIPTAENYGLSLSDVGAGLAVLTDNAMPAQRAATRLRMTFSLMAAPTGKAVKEFKKLGIGQYELARDMRKPNGLLVAVEDFNKHIKDSGLSTIQVQNIISRAFGGGRSSAAIMTLLEQPKRLAAKYVTIASGRSKFPEQVKAMQKTEKFKIGSTKSQLEGSLIAMNKTLAPFVEHVLAYAVTLMRQFVGWWQKLSPATQKTVVHIAAFLAILGPILIILGPLVGFIGKFLILFSTIGKIGIAMTTAGTEASGAVAIMEGLGSIIMGGALLAALAYTATEIYKVIKLWRELRGLNSSSESEILALGAETANSEAFAKLIENAHGKHKVTLENIKKQANERNTVKQKEDKRYSGFTGGILQASDMVTSSFESFIKRNAALLTQSSFSKPIMGKNYGPTQLIFHFHDIVAGDQGVKDIITKTVDKINRGTQLRTFAGTRS